MPEIAISTSTAVKSSIPRMYTLHSKSALYIFTVICLVIPQRYWNAVSISSCPSTLCLWRRKARASTEFTALHTSTKRGKLNPLGKKNDWNPGRSKHPMGRSSRHTCAHKDITKQTGHYCWQYRMHEYGLRMSPSQIHKHNTRQNNRPLRVASPAWDVDSKAIHEVFHVAVETEIWTKAWRSWRPGQMVNDRDRKKSQNLERMC
jgi:hypothetical protein